MVTRQHNFEPNKFDPRLLQKLKNIGYNAEEKKSKIIGKVDAILVNDGIITLGADYRGDDTAVAY